MPTGNIIDDALEDFPKSEIWRLQTDGWQAGLGPGNFRPAFYAGMDAGLEYLREHHKAPLTPELIEGLYLSAYKYEDNFADEEVLQRGYNIDYGGFEIFLPLPGLEHTAGISLAGLDEFVEALKRSHEKQRDNPSGRKFPQMDLCVEIGSSDFKSYLNPLGYKSLDEFKAVLLEHLRNASGSKDICTGPKTPPDRLTKVEIISNKTTRELVLLDVQNDIDAFNGAFLKTAEIDNVEDKTRAEVKAIVCFIRKLHQSHYFPDGNGRTFVFLLANLLLVQKGYSMKITENPAHFAGFSGEELVNETLQDLAHFQKYKITRAREYLERLTAGEINDDTKALLVGHLSVDPLIAMAQLNELFQQIRDNQISVPLGYVPSSPMWSFFSSFSPIRRANGQILNILIDAYSDKLSQLVQESHKTVPEHLRIGYGSEQEASSVLRAIVSRHQISTEKNGAQIQSIIDGYGAGKSAGNTF